MKSEVMSFHARSFAGSCMSSLTRKFHVSVLSNTRTVPAAWIPPLPKPTKRSIKKSPVHQENTVKYFILIIRRLPAKLSGSPWRTSSLDLSDPEFYNSSPEFYDSRSYFIITQLP